VTTIWIAGAENPAHHELFHDNEVSKAAVNVSSLYRNYGGDDWKPDFPVTEWVAWADAPATLDQLMTVVEAIGVHPTMVVGPEDWSSHDAWMPLWSGTTDMPTTIPGGGLFVTDAVFTDKALNKRVLAARKRDMVLGVVTGKSRGIERYDAVISSAWWSVLKHGETQVWDGDKFHRLNASSKQEARQRFSGAINDLGLNEWAVLADEPDAVASLALRSWTAYGDSLDTAPVLSIIQGEGQSVATTSKENHPSNRGSGSAALDMPTPRERHVLPSMSVYREVVEDEEGGIIEETLMVGSTSASIRNCDNCHLASACPAVQPGASCAYSMPVEIRTKDQLQKVMQAIVEVQTQRVFQARFAEEVQGQELSPDTGAEMDRMFKLIEKMRDIMDNRDTLRIAVESRGGNGGGVLSRLFGANVGTAAQSLATPINSNDVIDAVDP
jgi:hypothetical protein